MSKTLTETLTKTTEGMRLYQQERAILDVTELVCQVMHKQDVSRSQLADRLGKTKGYITQLLDGRTNMTVRTISDVFVALNRAVHFQEGSLEATIHPTPTISLDVGIDWVQRDVSFAPVYEFDTAAPTSIQIKMAS